jgi:hypothetical protein
MAKNRRKWALPRRPDQRSLPVEQDFERAVGSEAAGARGRKRLPADTRKHEGATVDRKSWDKVKWRLIRNHLGYSKEELELFKANPRNREPSWTWT